MKIKKSIKFYCRANAGKSGKSSIYLIYRFNQEARLSFNTGESINPKNWLKMRQEVNKNEEGFETINANLNSFNKKFLDLISEIEKLNIEPNPAIINQKFYNPDWRPNMFLDKEVKKLSRNIYDVFDRFIASKKGNVKDEVVRGYNTLRRHLKAYERHARLSLSLEQINTFDFYNKFKSFLSNEVVLPNKTIGLKDNTVGKQIKVIKHFLRYCEDSGIIGKADTRLFKVLRVEVDNVYLTDDELKKIYDLDLSESPELIKFRDVFLIGCYTGLRFSDYSSIIPANVNEDYISLTQKKVKASVIIPLAITAKKLLEKYDNNISALKIKKDFNTNVRFICKKAKIANDVEIVTSKGIERISKVYKKHELIASHTARRTFCTNEYMKNDLAPHLIMKISGHKQERDFMRYIKSTNMEAAELMLKIIREREKKATET